MLTGELLQYTRRGGRVHPRRVDPSDPRLQAAAAGLMGLFQAHLGERRADLDEAISRFLPEGLDAKRVRGLAKLLWERCEFKVASGIEPARLREALFDAGAAAWAAEDAGSAPWRASIVSAVAGTLGLTPEAADQSFYADLEENQTIISFDPLTPERLLQRFNVAQVQGLLLRAERLSLRSPWPTPQRLRQMLRYLKFFGLLFTLEPETADGKPALTLTVDGPLSVLEGSTRYGLNLAQFLPALLLWEGPWRLTAEVCLRRGQNADLLEVSPHPDLRSHYPDRGQWVPEDVRRFVSAFNDSAGPWRVAPAEDVLLLPGNAFLVPDFRFAHAPSGRTLALEHVLYPTPERMAALLERAERAGPERYAFAARAAAGIAPSSWLFTYRRTLTPAAVRTWLEALPPP